LRSFRFCQAPGKADWDTWIHTTRLEVNLRLLAQRNEPTYFGNTLWCSYSVGDFQPCGYGFGPLQAAGARHTECSMLPHGKDDAVGPFPYAAGLFWGLSYDIVRWMAGSRLVYDFVHNASARFEPPYWVKGEDSAFGFFLHISPFKKARAARRPRRRAPPPPPLRPHPRRRSAGSTLQPRPSTRLR